MTLVCRRAWLGVDSGANSNDTIGLDYIVYPFGWGSQTKNVAIVVCLVLTFVSDVTKNWQLVIERGSGLCAVGRTRRRARDVPRRRDAANKVPHKRQAFMVAGSAWVIVRSNGGKSRFEASQLSLIRRY